MRLVQLLSHSIEAHDQLRLYNSIGIEPFDIGGYIDPAHPHDPKRPALPDVPFFPELKDAVDSLGTDDNLGAAQAHIPDAILEWLGDDGVIVAHHYLERLIGQWPRIRDWKNGSPERRVIWRTVGQSVEHNERMMAPLHRDGLEIVRYSPKERNIPGYAGEDALIRFYKDPAEWYGWTGHVPEVINFTQHLAQRHPYTNYGFWQAATAGLPAIPMGPGSSEIGGTGERSYDDMKQALRDYRVYLYTGTQPASYTLGLIEAMMTGIPVVSIGPQWMRIFPYGPDMFEGHELVVGGPTLGYSDPAEARRHLVLYLNDHAAAAREGERQRTNAIRLFGFETIRDQWADFLGVKVAA